MDNKTNKKLISNGSSYHKKRRRWKGFREREMVEEDVIIILIYSFYISKDN